MGTARRAGILLLVAAAACSRATPSSPGPSPDPARSVEPAHSAPAPAVSVETLDPPGVYMGRTIAQPMSWKGADWLDRPNRDAVQKPEQVLDSLAIREGQTVADVGCGSGYFTVHLARRVGPRGRVFATDLQSEMLDLLRKKLDAAKLTNVLARLATEADPNLPAGEVDLVLMVDVYHELGNPPATLAHIKRSLAKGGRLALVEYRAEDPKVAIKPEHKTTLVQLRRELEANGYSFVSSDELLPEQRIVVFVPAGGAP
jgi:ubiquinone/menaquinone biosynthesis C-methylase UbiE